MAYGGTLVTNGYGVGIVVLTGDYTETGKISQTMFKAEELETPLTKRISYFSKKLLFVILGLSSLEEIAKINPKTKSPVRILVLYPYFM